jgi:hypothetical protein
MRRARYCGAYHQRKVVNVFLVVDWGSSEGEGARRKRRRRARATRGSRSIGGVAPRSKPSALGLGQNRRFLAPRCGVPPEVGAQASKGLGAGLMPSLLRSSALPADGRRTRRARRRRRRRSARRRRTVETRRRGAPGRTTHAHTHIFKQSETFSNPPPPAVVLKALRALIRRSREKRRSSNNKPNSCFKRARPTRKRAPPDLETQSRQVLQPPAVLPLMLQRPRA